MSIQERLRAGSGGGKHWQELETEAANRIDALEKEVIRQLELAKRFRQDRDVMRDKLEAMQEQDMAGLQQPVSTINGEMT